MQGHSTMILCDACGRAIPDQSSKEVLYQIDKVRYRLELCSNCLDAEMKRHDGHRGVPGFRKRAAIIIRLASVDDLPKAVKVG
jgi:ribosomal protein S26